jgi:hypothetical protein
MLDTGGRVHPDDERCAEARRLERLDDAFRRGDLAALREALDDPGAVPNGPMPLAIGSCLVYAVYCSPVAFIRTLLELGADPNAPVDDGFPPLIAALSTAAHAPGATPRDDVPEVVRLLLAAGADPNQRGINDYTPLHMAVSLRNARAVVLLIEAGADPALRTRIDDYETPAELAARSGFHELVALLTAGPPAAPRQLRPGLTVTHEVRGGGDAVRRGGRYRLRIRIRIAATGELVRWTAPSGHVGGSWLEDEGETLVTDTRVDRRSLVNGVFYGLGGMHVGGTRRLAIAPHLAYASRGVPGRIPPHAALDVEVTVLAPVS